MSNAGRPKKPANLHLLHGTHDASRHGKKAKSAEAKKQPRPGIPSPPKWLGPEALREWRRITRALNELGYIALTDRAILAQYCFLWGQLAEEPYLFTVQHHARLNAIQTQLGLTPAARSKMAGGLGNDDDDDGNPLADGWGGL